MKTNLTTCLKSKIVGLGIFILSQAYSTVTAQTFTDRSNFVTALRAVTTIDFEGIALGPGQAYAVNLVGNEFQGVTLTAGAGADGLFVGIPDPTVSGGNNENFFAGDFFPTSGLAVFSPDNYPSPGSPSPEGKLIVDFDEPTNGVGAYFLDAEEYPSYIEAFDGPSGTGNSLGKLIVQNKGDNSQAFAGVLAEGIKSAILVLGGGRDGVGLDDLCFGKNISCGNNNDKVLICHKDGNTLCVAEAASKAHLDHGDYYGPCASSTRKNKYESILAARLIQNNPIIVHPNPFKDTFTLEIKQNSKNRKAELNLYDMNGTPVKTIKEISTKNLDVDMSTMAKGVYIYTLKNEREIMVTGKVIKE